MYLENIEISKFEVLLLLTRYNKHIHLNTHLILVPVPVGFGTSLRLGLGLGQGGRHGVSSGSPNYHNPILMTR